MKQDKVTPIPKGYHTVTPSLVIHNSAQAIEFYKKALGATEVMRMNAPDGSITHAEIKIGDSTIMLNDEHGSHPGHDENCPKAPTDINATTSSFYLYVENVDAAFKRAVDAGARNVMPVEDMFWGDRMGAVKDPFGYLWTLASRTRIPTPKEIEEGAKEFYSQMAAQTK